LFASDVLIQGNQFLNNGFSLRYLYDDFHSGSVAFKAARYVSPNEPGNIGRHADQVVDQNEYSYRNLQIRDNIFYHWRKSAISVRNAERVTITGNSIGEGIPRNLVELPAVPIQVHFANQIEINSNISVGGTDAVRSTNATHLTSSNTQHVLNHGLEAWFKFDTGTIHSDSSGNQVTPQFSQTGVAPGKFDSAIQLNGQNSISLTGLDQTEASSRTVSLWFNHSDANRTQKQVIFEEGDSSNGFSIYLERGLLFIGAWANGSFSTFLQTEYRSEHWNHVAFVLDADGFKLRGYLNGEKFAAGNAFVIPPREGDATLGAAGVGGTRFDAESTTVSGFGFSGLIDEVKIFSRVLGDGEISGLAGRI